MSKKNTEVKLSFDSKQNIILRQIITTQEFTPDEFLAGIANVGNQIEGQKKQLEAQDRAKEKINDTIVEIEKEQKMMMELKEQHFKEREIPAPQTEEDMNKLQAKKFAEEIKLQVLESLKDDSKEEAKPEEAKEEAKPEEKKSDEPEQANKE